MTDAPKLPWFMAHPDFHVDPELLELEAFNESQIQAALPPRQLHDLGTPWPDDDEPAQLPLTFGDPPSPTPSK